MDVIHTDAQAVEHTLRRMLSFVDDPDREGLQDTPDRIRRSWEQLFSGYRQKGADVLSKTFTDCGDYDEMVVLKGIDFYSFCEHHFLPITGIAHIGYLPNGKVVGISKLARLVEVYARRLQIQERMTVQIATDIEQVLEPVGVAVVIEATHMCISSRGVEKQNARMITSRMTGAFRENPEAREEFLLLCGLGGR